MKLNPKIAQKPEDLKALEYKKMKVLIKKELLRLEKYTSSEMPTQCILQGKFAYTDKPDMALILFGTWKGKFKEFAKKELVKEDSGVIGTAYFGGVDDLGQKIIHVNIAKGKGKTKITLFNKNLSKLFPPGYNILFSDMDEAALDALEQKLEAVPEQEETESLEIEAASEELDGQAMEETPTKDKTYIVNQMKTIANQFKTVKTDILVNLSNAGAEQKQMIGQFATDFRDLQHSQKSGLLDESLQESYKKLAVAYAYTEQQIDKHIDTLIPSPDCLQEGIIDVEGLVMNDLSGEEIKLPIGTKYCVLAYNNADAIADIKVEIDGKTIYGRISSISIGYTVPNVIVFLDNSEFALTELSRMVEKDTIWLNFDEDKAIQLLRSFNGHEQYQFLQSEKLIEGMQYYFNKKHWGAAMSNWNAVALEEKLKILQAEEDDYVDYFHLREVVFYSPDKADFDCEKYLDGKILMLNTEEEYAAFFKDLGKTKEEAFRLFKLAQKACPTNLYETTFATAWEEIGLSYDPRLHKNEHQIPIQQDFLDKLLKVESGNANKDDLNVMVNKFGEMALIKAYDILDFNETTSQVLMRKYNDEGFTMAFVAEFRKVIPKYVDVMTFRKSHHQLGESKKSKQGILKELGGKYPFLTTLELSEMVSLYEKLSYKGTEKKMWSRFEQNSISILENIAATRLNIVQNKDLIWELQPVIDATFQQLSINPEGALGQAVAQKIASIKKNKEQRNLAIAALSIGTSLLAAFTSGGTSLLFSGLAVGIGAVDLSIQLSEANIQAAAANTAEEKARALTQEQPNYFFVALSVLGLGMDIAQAAQVLKSIIVAKGITEFQDIAQATRWADDVADEIAKKKSLSPEELENLKKQLKEGAEKLVTKVDDAAVLNELLQQLGHKYGKLDIEQPIAQLQKWLEAKKNAAKADFEVAKKKFTANAIDKLLDLEKKLNQKIDQAIQFFNGNAAGSFLKTATTSGGEVTAKVSTVADSLTMRLFAKHKSIVVELLEGAGPVMKYIGSVQELSADFGKVVFLGLRYGVFKAGADIVKLTEELRQWLKSQNVKNEDIETLLKGLETRQKTANAKIERFSRIEKIATDKQPPLDAAELQNLFDLLDEQFAKYSTLIGVDKGKGLFDLIETCANKAIELRAKHNLSIEELYNAIGKKFDFEELNNRFKIAYNAKDNTALNKLNDEIGIEIGKLEEISSLKAFAKVDSSLLGKIPMEQNKEVLLTGKDGNQILEALNATDCPPSLKTTIEGILNKATAKEGEVYEDVYARLMNEIKDSVAASFKDLIGKELYNQTAFIMSYLPYYKGKFGEELSKIKQLAFEDGMHIKGDVLYNEKIPYNEKLPFKKNNTYIEPDQLIFYAKTAEAKNASGLKIVDIKVGDGNFSPEQIENYLLLRDEYKAFLPTYKGSTKPTIEFLYLPNGKKSAKEAAEEAMKKMQGTLQKNKEFLSALKNGDIKIKYLDNDGIIKIVTI